MKCRVAFYITYLLLPYTLLAQEFSLQQFRAADGLRTDMVKCVAQDSLGFIWVGTDDGLIRYDGVEFTHYPEAANSNYFKDFLYTSDHRLLVIHDLGAVEIKSSIDTVSFETIIEGERTPTKDKLWYPKSIYEDSKGGIWFGEPQSVTRYYRGKLKRFEFGEKDNSSSFVRSFNFLQLYDERLLISSYTGNFYAYDFEEDLIDTLEVVGTDLTEIATMCAFNNEILVGCTNSLNRIQVEEDKVYSQLIYDNVSSSDIQQISTTKLISSSFAQSAFVIELINGEYFKTEIPSTKASMNNAYLSTDSTIWLSTERGVITLEEFTFSKINIDLPNMYVEDIEIIPSLDKAYVIIKENVWEVDLNNLNASLVFEQKYGYFLSIEVVDSSLWITNGFEVWEVKNGKAINKIDFRPYGRYVFEIHKDRNELLWLNQEASIGVKSLNPTTYELKIYAEQQGLNYVTSSMIDSKKGIYVATEDAENYLFFKAHQSEKFQNISHQLPEKYRKGLNIIDIEEKNDEIWMATQFGIFIHGKDSVYQLKFNNNFQDVLTSDIEIHDDNVWFGNTFGLFRYNTETKEYAHFAESSGLPMNSVTEAEFQFEENNIWVGTPDGVALANIDYGVDRIVTKPIILSVNSNNEKITINKEDASTVANKAFLEIVYSNLCFPANTIEYSYRIKEISTQWSTPKGLNRAKFSNLSSGNYTFEIRARRLGGQRWSDATEFRFTVTPPFYLTTFFYFSVTVSILLLIAITRGITKYYMRNQQILLEAQVQERTAELKKIKRELELNNEQLEQRVSERTEALDKMNTALKVTNRELLYQRGELENALRDLQETQQKLVHSEKMASLGLLSAGVAHEINNPLNFIQGGVSGLDNYFKKNYQDTPSQVLRMIEIIKEGVSRSSTIVKSLNHFSRQGGADNEYCSIHEIIDNCFVMLHNKIKHKVEIIKDYADESFIIVGNEGKLHQAILNILTNAVQAINEKGCIRITTNIVNNKNVVILIEDTGTGIREDDLLRIKDPFFTTKDPGKGTGLGLSITQNILEEHKGTIEFDSVIGKGTTVRINLPANLQVV